MTNNIASLHFHACCLSPVAETADLLSGLVPRCPSVSQALERLAPLHPHSHPLCRRRAPPSAGSPGHSCRKDDLAWLCRPFHSHRLSHTTRSAMHATVPDEVPDVNTSQCRRTSKRKPSSSDFLCISSSTAANACWAASSLLLLLFTAKAACHCNSRSTCFSSCSDRQLSPGHFSRENDLSWPCPPFNSLAYNFPAVFPRFAGPRERHLRVNLCHLLLHRLHGRKGLKRSFSLHSCSGVPRQVVTHDQCGWKMQYDTASSIRTDHA